MESGEPGGEASIQTGSLSVSVNGGYEGEVDAGRETHLS
jgi:hypothetical protein